MNTVVRRMAAGIDSGVFPGAVLLAARGEEILIHRAFGVTDIFSCAEVTADTAFDLASLTKPLATAAAVMVLAAGGALTLDAPLAGVLPEFRHTEKAGVSIVQLLTHTSGFPAWRPVYRALRRMPQHDRKPALERMLVAMPLVDRPGRRTIYSDLGYMVLAWVVERVSGQAMDAFLDASVYGPLGVGGLFFPGPEYPGPDDSVAATEFCPWRNVLLSGRVHDDNADAAGGVAGHAGLFGTARGVHRLLSCMLAACHGDATPGVLPQDLVRRFFTPWGRSGRTPGFDRPEGPCSSAGRHFSIHSVGHLGFTGTSFWMDVDRRIIVVLLTNRVHPSRSNIGIRAFRPLIHDDVMEMVRRGSGASKSACNGR